MENLNKRRGEYLSNDILEENFIRSFAPFHAIQKLLGSCRVDIRDRFVSSSTKGQKMFTVITSIITLFLYIFIIVKYLYRFYEYPGIYYTALSCSGLYYLTFLFNMIHVRFINADSNSKFYIKLQEIDRLMKIDKIDQLYNYLFLNNAFNILCTLILLGIIFFLAVHENFALILGFTGMLYSMLCCSLEWLSCADLIVHFFLRVRFINSIIKNHVEDDSRLMEAKNTFNFPISYVCMRRLATEQHNFKTSNTHVYLQAVFDGFLEFQNHCRLQILLFFNQFFLQSLIIFEFSVLALQKNALHWMEVVVLPTAVSLSLVLAVVMCIRCELFFREVQQTKRLCITIMSQNYQGPLRTKAKKMLKMIENQPPQFSVYNMWYMNASTMIKTIDIITTLIVALLQFTYL